MLFVAEAATLAHVARPLVLSAALDSSIYEIGFASDQRCKWLLNDFRGRYLPLSSASSASFLEALARGRPLYDAATLKRYVHDDLALLEEFRPDVVVGDFRLSLSISARLRHIPYISISNCYWSPYWRPPRYVVPNLRPLTRIFPLPVADALFRLAQPIAFALHCRPLNDVRRSFGLPALGNDLRRAYTDADYVLYADMAELFPGVVLPANHRFIGPVVWSPPVSLPDWWTKLPAGRPIIYLTLGSSGQADLLPAILRSMSALDITVIAATAGSALPTDIPPNVYMAQYLPGTEAASLASVVVCNGGSPTSHQALAAGVPVIGIASNLDQFLNMGTLERAGAGEMMRADRFHGSALSALLTKMLRHPGYARAAKEIAAGIAGYDPCTHFATLIAQITSQSPGTQKRSSPDADMSVQPCAR